MHYFQIEIFGPFGILFPEEIHKIKYKKKRASIEALSDNMLKILYYLII